MATIEDSLTSMGLTPINDPDEVVRFNNYNRRSELQGFVKTTDTGLADYDSI